MLVFLNNFIKKSCQKFKANSFIVLGLLGSTFTFCASFAQQKDPMILDPKSNFSENSLKSSNKNPKNFDVEISDEVKKNAKRIKNSMKGTVQIDALQAIDINEIGILNLDQGALGFEMWFGVSKEFVKNLFSKLPQKIKSEIMRDLLGRLLLSPARAPEPMRQETWLISERLKKLVSIGNIKESQRLLGVIPDISEEPELVKLDLELSLLNNDLSKVCSISSRVFPQTPSSYWQEIFNFCNYITEGADKAALGISLMREAGGSSERFFNLADALISGEILELDEFSNPSALDLAMIQEANVKIPFSSILTTNPNALRSVALNSKAPLVTRLAASDEAHLLGVFSSQQVRNIYDKLSFSDDEIANPLSQAEIRFGPRVRALLHYTAKNQALPASKAEAISRALFWGRYENRYFSTVQVFGPLIKSLKPTEELSWFAGEAARAMLILGDTEKAQSWYEVMESISYASKEGKFELDSFRPLASLTGLVGSKVRGASILRAWFNSVGHKKIQRALVLFQVLEAFGEDVPSDLWLDTITDEVQNNLNLPDLYIWNRLLMASEAKQKSILNQKQPKLLSDSNQQTSVNKLELNKGGQKYRETQGKVGFAISPGIGETILLALVALGEKGPSDNHPVVLKAVIKALLNIGLEKEARLLALEALLAQGL